MAIELDNLSDEDFLNASLAAEAPEPAASEEPAPEPVAEPEPVAAAAEPEEAEEQADPAEVEGDDDEDQTPAPAEDDASEDAAEPQAEAESEEAEDPSSDKDHTTPHQATPVDYKAEYEKIMAPFKANGREVKLENPDEVIRLMQMGANYTKKMQALKPNLKLMRMLENNKLLDESKLSFLIDLDRKDPAAIQKLIHDSQIDPLDLDAATTPAYTPGNHAVSDREMDFQSTLEDVTSTELGKDTVSHINQQWDQASKEAIFQEPKILQIITDQRENGIYAQISAEIDKRRMLGNLPEMSFLEAYRTVGDDLHAQGKLTPKGATAQPRRVVETRVAKPKPAAANNDKVRAASPAKTTPQSTAKPEFDVFAMSDEEFMAQTNIKI